MDFADDNDGIDDMPSDNAPGPSVEAKADKETAERRKKHVSEIIRRIKDDKQHHAKAFKRMRRDMKVAMWGAEDTWHADNYRANIVGRHVKMKTAALYAKNPKAVARRRETLDFAIWDESAASLEMAMMMQQQGVMLQQQAAALPPIVDEMTGQLVPQQPPMPPGYDQAMALIQDFQDGMQRRQMITKFGKTLEVLFAYALREQKPLDFKRGMKTVVRRALTTCVGYVELGFQREYGERPAMAEKLADSRQRIDHLRNLASKLAEGEIDEYSAEADELEASLLSLQKEAEEIIREGLIIDYPQSTKVIPDRMCRQLDGFIGAQHVSIEYAYTVDEVKEIFGVDLGDKYTAYTKPNGYSHNIVQDDIMDEDYEWKPEKQKKSTIVCVWKHYHKPSGMVYYVADGHDNFLREPAAPDVFVETFWPVYALTFNAVESEDELFPPSDVTLLLDMQREYNRSRQGQREHRHAARPRWVYPNGAFGNEEDPMLLKNLKPLEMVGLDIDPQTPIGNVLQTVPIPGVDPNLYATEQIFSDMQLVGGAQEAQYGGVAKSTATESAIAANSTTSSDGSSIDDLDSFLSVLARDAGQILIREMSEEQVLKIAGPGAVWPQMSAAEIAEEVSLEVEAGSTGRPNKAVEINNWQQLLPMLIQMPKINPEWLARETLRRLDDRMDLTEAVASNMPSIVAQNQMAQIGPTEAGAGDPNAQGGEGANNAPQPPEQGGTGPAFGSNQV